MRTVLRISIFISFAIIVFACKTSQNQKLSPEKTCDLFFGYLNNYEYEKAKELGTEQTVKKVSLVESLSKLGGGDKIILKDNKSQFLYCETSGKEAVCNFKTYSGDIQRVYLLRQKGRWLVDLRKDAEKPANKEE
ncbi:MAG TPA: hypothetical protein PLI16_01395 [Bacteroidales bacterium]|jgi:hypothetical protein|nr:hypothetical protein [Bacteroidales bacterium]HOH83244.1 hypothetical protein [Bacteroidales bacterium]HPB25087.1 hypothetical protein [Bacteroidales bacterium]HPI31073.1 hypothetical protein [Bacteroidales bacterium]HQN16981.1 hypothetical protein [Bacteroidales bacterium]